MPSPFRGSSLLSLPSLISLALLLCLARCTRLKSNQVLPGASGGGTSGVEPAGSGGEDPSTGGSGLAGSSGSGKGGASGSGAGGASGGTTAGSGGVVGGGDGGAGDGGAGDGGTGAAPPCVDECTGTNDFTCADTTHAQACVLVDRCWTWQALAACPDEFICCDGACTRDDGLMGCDGHGIQNPELSVPGDMGRWCSVRYIGDQGWDILWGNEDPCATLLASHASAMIDRAGLYTTLEWNNVDVYCGDGVQHGIYIGPRETSLRVLRDAVWGVADCRFTVAPTKMPLFEAPFSISEVAIDAHDVQLLAGFDFAYEPSTLNVTLYGGHGSTTATVVDHFANDQSSSTFADDNDGWDWSMREGTPIVAVAAGSVLASRVRGTDPACAGNQSEVYIQHDVGHGAYRESFVTQYRGLSTRSVASRVTVHSGDLIGYAGGPACPFHFAVTRLTNANGWYQETFETEGTPVGDNLRGGRIDPFGWAAGPIDPWGTRHPNPNLGAWSIRLWKSEQAPPEGSW